VVDGGFKLKLARNIEITGEIQYQNISKPGFVQVHWGMNRKTDSWLKDVKGCLFFFPLFIPNPNPNHPKLGNLEMLAGQTSSIIKHFLLRDLLRWYPV
jgi:hypothetical protein